MTIHYKNITSQSQFHEYVLEMKKVSDATDQQLTTKLKGKKGSLEGRVVTFLKQLLSLLPGVNLARTNPYEVAKAIEKFAENYYNKNFLSQADQQILANIVDRLTGKGKNFSKQHLLIRVAHKIIRIPTELKSNDKASPLVCAIFDKDHQKFNAFLNFEEANKPSKTGNFPLHYAAQTGDLEMVKRLIPLTKDGVNVAGDGNRTPLFFATLSGKANVVKYLLENQADANLCDVNGNTSFHLAALQGYLAILNFLLPKTKDALNLKGGSQYTPLHHSIISGNLNVVKFLLSNKADPNIPESNGALPLHFAVCTGDIKFVKLLLPKTKDGINVKASEKTPLSIAAKNNLVEMTKWLLKNGADATIPDEDGKLPRELATNKQVDLLSSKK